MLLRLNLYDFSLVGFMQLFLASALFLSPARRASGYRRWTGSRTFEVFLNSTVALVMAVIACFLVSVIWGIALTTLQLSGIVVTLIAVIVVIARPDCNVVGQIFSAAFITAGLGLVLFTVNLTTKYANGGLELLAAGFFVVLSIWAVLLGDSY